MKNITVMISQVNMNKFAPTIPALLLFAAFFCCISTLSVFGQQERRTAQQTIDYLNKTLEDNFASDPRNKYDYTFRVDDKKVYQIKAATGNNVESCSYGKFEPYRAIKAIKIDYETEEYTKRSFTRVEIECGSGGMIVIRLEGAFRSEAQSVVDAIKYLMALEDGSVSAPSPSPKTTASPTPTAETPLNTSTGSDNGMSITVTDDDYRKRLAAEAERLKIAAAKEKANREAAAAKARAAQPKAKPAPRKKAGNKGKVTVQ